MECPVRLALPWRWWWGSLKAAALGEVVVVVAGPVAVVLELVDMAEPVEVVEADELVSLHPDLYS